MCYPDTIKPDMHPKVEMAGQPITILSIITAVKTAPTSLKAQSSVASTTPKQASNLQPEFLQQQQPAPVNDTCTYEWVVLTGFGFLLVSNRLTLLQAGVLPQSLQSLDGIPNAFRYDLMALASERIPNRMSTSRCVMMTLHLGREDRGKENAVSPPFHMVSRFELEIGTSLLVWSA